MKSDWSGFMREFDAEGGWRVVLASGIGYGLGLSSLVFFSLGAFVAPLEASFGWSRAQVQGSLGCITCATLAGGWAVGWLTDRYGVRRIAALSQLGLVAGLGLLATAQGSLWYWYATWLLLSFVGLGTTPITWTRGISDWFAAGRGFALALGLSTSGIVAFAAPAAAAILIGKIGWRASYLVLATAVLCVATPVTWLVFPKQAKHRRCGGGPAAPRELAGLQSRAALKSYRFWVVLLSASALGFAMGGLIPNLMPMLVGRGIAATTASSFLAVLGLSMIVGRLVAGYALDRLWAPAVACIFLPWPALGCFILAQDTVNAGMIGVSTASVGLATGVEFDLLPYLCASYFGMRSYGRIYALQWAGFSTAAGLAPAVFGHTYDVTGHYAPILYVASLLFLTTPFLLLTLGRYPALEQARTTVQPVQAGMAT